jgi:hypothetical protein
MATIDTISGPAAATVPSPPKPTGLRSNWSVLLAIAAPVTALLLPTQEGWRQ